MSAVQPVAADPLPSYRAPRTRGRFIVLAFICSLAFILYLDRVCIGRAETSIREEFGFDKTQMAYVFMAFTLAYGIFEVPTGHFGDRFGSRGVLTRIVVWWSLFTALTGAAMGLYSLIAVRFLFGVGEAGAYPNSARVLGRWFPDGERGMAQGLVLTSAQLGAALSPPIAAYLIAGIGWRLAFVVFGALGVVWAVAFYLWFRDDPAKHPAVNDAENEYIAANRRLAAATEAHGGIPWAKVLRSPNVWLLAGIQTSGAFAAYMYMSWYATYLTEARGVELIEGGWLAGLVMAGGAVGCLGGGFFSAWVVRFDIDRVWSRRLYGCGVMVAAAGFLAASTFCDSAVAAASLTAVACMLALSQQSTWWSVAGEISGKHLGALFGLMNGVAVFGAMGSQYFFAAFADWRESLGYTGRAQWDPAFWVDAGILVAGGLLWLFLDPTKSAVGEETVEGH